MKSVFELIQILQTPKAATSRVIDKIVHCDQHTLHDYYCDAEMPYHQHLV